MDEVVALVSELDSYVHVELELDNNNCIEGHERAPGTHALFQDAEDENSESSGSSGDDSGTDPFGTAHLGTRLQRCEHKSESSAGLPDTFQTGHLLFYERFKAYQDYVLGDCKPSEVKAFTADYLEKVVEPCDWLALWCTDVFDVLVEVRDVDFKDLKAVVRLVVPMQCQAKGCELTEDNMKSVLEATQRQVPLKELHAVYEESGEFEQTALAIEHHRFFYKHIWRQWDEEDEDDDFDYFVRCVEPRLRLYYDILEDRVPAGLVVEYQTLLENCSRVFEQFSVLRSGMSCDSDSELDNVSMVEGLKLYDQLETYKRKLHIIENPLLRYVLGYKGNARQQCVQSRGPRDSGLKVVHIVTSSCTSVQLQSLLNDRLLPMYSNEDTEIKFYGDPVSAVDSCHEGDVVIVLPGVFNVTSSINLPDSVTIEGFGLPDEVVIEKKGKGDSFVDSTGTNVKISNIKFIQHDAIEGILCVRQGNLDMENCVLQCETTGVIVRTSAHLTMNICDLYGSKGAGIEIYPGSVCSLIGNGIHHCKDGILIKDFASEHDVLPSITMENNVIHNNEGYGVILVKPSVGEEPSAGEELKTEENIKSAEKTSGSSAEPQLVTTFETPPNRPPTDSDSGPDDDGGGPGDGDLLVASARKWQLCRQLSRSKEATCSRPVQDLLNHEIFVSIQENQFKRNGMGDFGTFIC
ncbi:SHC SH2 domain-binding protein 1 [Eucyclogobius newberryi]|uniref:SHC SH2 domain-binding protein 1 n=1 Tax=Eucyclogobius newberryi TaxID=166745 RepID=UPI003B5B248B